jgi:hypothetical protein
MRKAKGNKEKKWRSEEHEERRKEWLMILENK